MSKQEEVEQEIEALQAIYGEECFSYRTSAWGSHGPPSFAIKITPLKLCDEKDVSSSLTLRFTLLTGYPKTIPKVEVEQSKGLSAADLKDLNCRIVDVAKRHVGQVMCYEIAEFALSFLRERYEEPQTLYEVMINREKKEEKALRDLFSPLANQKVGGVSSDDKDSKVISESLPSITNPSLLRLVESDANGEDDSDDPLDDTSDMDEGSDNLSRPQNESPQDGDDDSVESNTEEPKPLSSPDLLTLSNSRYWQEFTELSLLGSGASGEVWKVRNKLDRRIYAVKKIFITSNLTNSANISRKIRREVTTISRLLHKNIVRYYAAWVESQPKPKKSRCNGSSSESDSESDSRELSPGVDSKEDILKAIPTALQKLSNLNINSDVFDFEFNDEPGDFRTSGFVPDDSSSSDSYDDSDSDSDGSNESGEKTEQFPVSHSESKSSEQGPTSRKRDEQLSTRCLFIQMEFCCSTLRELIDEGKLHSDHFTIIKLFRQTLDALAYIHGRRVIHRDLKPANIFLDAESNIKIGDFGLATSGRRTDEINEEASQRDREGGNLGNSTTFEFINSQSSNNASIISDESLTHGVGTAMYRAPEQGGCVTTGSPKFHPSSPAAGNSYNEKADMFSMGVILFEMCHPPFVTGTERIITLQALKEKGVFPKGFGGSSAVTSSADFCRIISLLLQANPTKRPSALELLSSPLLPSRADADESYLKEIKEGLWSFPLRIGVIAELFRHGAMLAGSKSETDVSLNEKSLFYYADELWKSHNLLLPKLSSKKYRMEKPVPQKHDPIISNHSITLSCTPLSVINFLKKICVRQFELLGAVDFHPPLFQLSEQKKIEGIKSSVKAAEKRDKSSVGHIKMLDLHGKVLTLPASLTTSFARYASLLQLKSAARYCIDHVYSAAVSRSRGGESNVVNASQVQGDIHPQSTVEAVLDVIYPSGRTHHQGGSDDLHILAQSEVISAAVRCLYPLQSCLPDYVVRITDCRVLDCILEFCAWPQTPHGKQQPKTPPLKQSIDDSQPYFSSLQIDKSRLLRNVSLGIDAEADIDPSSSSYFNDLNLPELFLKRFIRFMKILFNQGAKAPKYDPTEVLNALSQEFFRSVLEMQRSSAREHSGGAVISAPPVDKTTADSSGTAASLPTKTNKGTATVIPKEYIKSSNFDPIKISSIGVKAETNKRSQKSAPYAPTILTQKEDAISAATVLQEPLLLNKSSDDEDQLRALIQSFDKAIRDMRAVMTCLMSSKGLSGTRILVDLGLDPRILSQSSSTSAFCSGGALFFAIEAYSAINTTMNETTTSKNIDHPITPASIIRKRHKGMGGVLVEGGHFEQCLTSDSLYAATAVTAFGCRLRLEVITALIVKKQLKLRSSKEVTIQAIPQPAVSSGIVPAVFVVSVAAEESLESMATSADNYSPSSAAHVFHICEELRSLGISATGYIHHLLRGMEVSDVQSSSTPSKALITICKNIGILFIVQIFGPPSAIIQNAYFKIINLGSEVVIQKAAHIHVPDPKLKYSELIPEMSKRLPVVAASAVDKASKAAGAHTTSKKQSTHQASSTLASDISKVALNGPKKSPPAAQVSLIILESMENDGAVKDTRKAANKSRNRDMLRLKVANALKNCSMVGMFDRHLASNTTTTSTTTISSSSGGGSSGGVEEVVVELLSCKSSSMFTKSAPAVMVAVDLPFRVIRSVTTIIMYYAQTTTATLAIAGASSREEYESLLSNESVAKYRKQVKQLVAELAQYSKYVQPSSTVSSNSGVSSPAPSASHDHSMIVGQRHGLLVQVYVFSLLDERFDIVSYDPVMLNQFKWN